MFRGFKTALSLMGRTTGRRASGNRRHDVIIPLGLKNMTEHSTKNSKTYMLPTAHEHCPEEPLGQAKNQTRTHVTG
jgi:hypothetical protein